MTRVLLTGAFGNIGSHTLPELVGQGHSVRCFDLPARASRRQARRLDGVEVVWGDIREPGAVADAVSGMEVVVHLAAIIPPMSEKQPDLAQAINVGGTRNVIAAARAADVRPRLLLASTLDVHGRTFDQPPPRRVTDPVVATDAYTAHKIECEELVAGAGLTWCVLRFADVPVLGIRAADPVMFEIGLHTRIESLHSADAGLAIANALTTPEVWNRVLFVGGGASCQLTYRQYLDTMMGAMGLKPLPDDAFSTADYVTDWLDTQESQRLLRYQRHDFADIAAAVTASLGWRRPLVRLAAPLARASMLRMSPYLRAPRRSRQPGRAAQ